MSAAVKLSLYGAVLVAVFFAAFLVTSLVTGDPVSAPASPMGGH